MDNEQKITSFSKYRLLKESIEKKLSNPIIWILVFLNRIIRPKDFKVEIPGEIQKSSADSYHHETNVKIAIKRASVDVKIGPFVADSANENFPFKNMFVFFKKINMELIKLDDSLQWKLLLRSIFM